MATLLPHKRTDCLPQCCLLVTRHMLDLRIAVLTHEVSRHLGDESEAVVDPRLRKVLVHEAEAAAAVGREGHLAEGAEDASIAAGHECPLLAAESLGRPAGLEQSDPIVVSYGWHLALVVEVERLDGPTATLALLGGQMYRRSAADLRQQEDSVAGLDDVDAVQRFGHVPIIRGRDGFGVPADGHRGPDRAGPDRPQRERPRTAFALVTGPFCTVWRVEDSNLCSFRDGFTVRSHWPLGQPAWACLHDHS